ncbi:MAG TPA: DUF1894 domain-containing protein [Methanocorpusculum sp.]|nr:DUF1894 domain-containing protein [Methanocorpusculum sp.]
MNYEILGRNCSFKEAREIIRANSTERYEVPPGFKLLDKALIGVPPLIIGIANEKLVYAYTKPCHGTFVVVVEDPTGVEVVRRSGKPVK